MKGRESFLTCDSNRRFIRVLLLAEENLLLWDIKYWLYVISVENAFLSVRQTV